ncbi:MAG: hypothetical protein ACI9DC_001272 [Gammaproteobacteria bacterium]|jgi:hypothetical protein
MAPANANHNAKRVVLDEQAIDDSLCAQALEALGEQRMTEVFGLLGIYTSVCLTLVAYRVPSKFGEPNPLS